MDGPQKGLSFGPEETQQSSAPVDSKSATDLGPIGASIATNQKLKSWTKGNEARASWDNLSDSHEFNRPDHKMKSHLKHDPLKSSAMEDD
jgi:hypothetical protein